MRYLKQILAVVLALALLAGTWSVALAGGPKNKKFDFDDWDDDFWANESLARMVLKGVLKGKPDRTLAPNKPVTRLEALITLVRLLGLEEAQEAGVFFSGRGRIKLEDGEWKIEREDSGSKFKVEFKNGRWSVEWEEKGKGKQENKGKVTFADSDQVPAWGRAALEHGLRLGFALHDNGFLRLNQPLKRVEAAVMLVKAAGLDEAAQAAGDTPLPFTDAQAIPAGYRGYVALAVQHGLITGYPNNLFLPNKPVTRAEWAVMIDRLDRQGGEHVDVRQVRGTVTALSTGTPASITVVTTRFPAGVTYQVDPGAHVSIGGRAAALGEVLVGDSVILNLNPARQVAMITVLVNRQQVTGLVQAFTAPAGTANGSISILKGGSVPTYAVLPGATVTLDGAASGFGEVRQSDQVTLTLERGRAVRIAITSTTDTLSGSILAVTLPLGTAPGVLVLNVAGQQRTFTIAAAVQVLNRQNQAITLADLRQGDSVQVRLTRGLVTRIAVTSGALLPGQVEGVVTARTAATGSAPATISVRPAGQASPVTYSVAETAAITWDGAAIPFAAILVGDTVRLTAANNTATAITLWARAGVSASGTLLDVSRTTRTFTFHFVPAGATQPITLAVHYPGGTPVRFGDFHLGDAALAPNMAIQVAGAVADGDLNAVTITIDAANTVTLSGTVKTLTTTGGVPQSMRLQVGSVEGLLSVSPTAAVTLNGQSIGFAALQLGDAVSVQVQGGSVVAIALTGRASLSAGGTLTAIDRAARTFTLSFVPAGAPSAVPVQGTYTAATAVRYGDFTLSDAALAAGQAVEFGGSVAAGKLAAATLTIAPGNNLVLTGTVVSTSQSGGQPQAIRLRVNGSQGNLSVSPTVTVTRNGATVPFASLHPGDNATVTITAGLVTGISATSN